MAHADWLDSTHAPIGLWLRRADEAITRHVNEVQAANGVSRTEWQALNLLHEADGASEARIADALRLFVDPAAVAEILARFRREEWIEPVGAAGPVSAEFRLTAAGRERHGEILRAQQEVRRRAIRGISPEEYATVLRVLERIVRNLERGARVEDGGSWGRSGPSPPAPA